MSIKILTIGGSSSVGLEIAKASHDFDIDIRATYFNNKEKLFGYVEDSVYFNYSAQSSSEDIKSLIDGIDVIIDCTSVERALKEDFINRISELDANIRYISLSDLTKDLISKPNIMSIKPSLVVGKDTRFDREILDNLSHGIVPLPVDSMSTGKPIHVKDLALCLLALSTSDDAFLSKNSIIVEGSVKVTISHTIKEILLSYGKKYLIAFYVRKDWLLKVNEFLRKHLNVGVSDDVMNNLESYSLRAEGDSMRKFINIKPLSVHARYIEFSNNP